MAPEIKGFVETSFCDWDGRISTVVFLAGCNLRCPFCQNGDLVLAPERLPTVDPNEVLRYLERQRGWIDGVVVTGGEPTIWDDLPDLLAGLRSSGLAVKLDTNGTDPEAVASLARQGLVEFVAMDVKAPLDGRYHRAAGVTVDLGAIAASIEFLKGLPDGASEFRTTLVPGLVGEDEVMEIAALVGAGARYVLQPFVAGKCLDANFDAVTPYADEFARALAARAAERVKTCSFRGRKVTVLPGPGGRL